MFNRKDILLAVATIWSDLNLFLIVYIIYLNYLLVYNILSDFECEMYELELELTADEQFNLHLIALRHNNSYFVYGKK
jgi:hypothetical protein